MYLLFQPWGKCHRACGFVATTDHYATEATIFGLWNYLTYHPYQWKNPDISLSKDRTCNLQIEGGTDTKVYVRTLCDCVVGRILQNAHTDNTALSHSSSGVINPCNPGCWFINSLRHCQSALSSFVMIFFFMKKKINKYLNKVGEGGT